MSELKLRPPKTQTRISFGCLFLLFDGDSELVELVFVNIGWGLGHQILGGGGFRKGDDFADGPFAGEEHDYAVDTEGDAAVRRSAIGQGIEEEAETVPELLLGKTERSEKALLYILAVDTTPDRAELVFIKHDVIAFGANLAAPRLVLQFVQVFFNNTGEGMLGTDPGFVGLTPLEERKAGEPKKFPLRFVDHAERFAKLQTQLSGDERSSFRAFDLFLGGNGDDEVAGFRAARFRKFFHILSANQFLDRRSYTVCRHFYKVRATRVQRLGPFCQFVQLFARIACRTGRRERKDAAFDLQFLPGIFRKAVRHIVKLHAKAQVRLVAAVFSNGIPVEHVRKRRLGLDSRDGASAHHDVFDHVKNIFLPREGHLQIELRELELAVSALIFVAEALPDLEVFVQPSDHQDLLENLRRLRERVKLPVMNAAGHQKIARALRSRAREHRRFHFEEAHLVHDLANFQNNLVTQREVPVRLTPTQIEIAETQSRLFRSVDFVFDWKRRRLRVVQNVQLRRSQFAFPACQVRIGFVALKDLRFHGDDEFTARLFGFSVRRGLRLFVEDHLHDAGTVTHIKKEQIAEVAPPRHPAHHNSIAPFVLCAQFATVVCALQVAQKIQHGLNPLYFPGRLMAWSLESRLTTNSAYETARVCSSWVGVSPCAARLKVSNA